MAYELFEIRSGYGLLPIHRLSNRIPEGTVTALRSEIRGVMQKAFGDDGAQKRANVENFREKLAECWEASGEGWKEIEKIVALLSGRK